MVNQCAATPLAAREHHIVSGTVEQPDRGCAELGSQHWFRTAAEQRDASLRSRHQHVSRGGVRRQPFGCEREHRRERLERGHRGEGLRGGTRQPREAQRPAEATGMRQHCGKKGAKQPLRHRPPVTPLDIGAGVIDQVHIVHAGPTGMRQHCRKKGAKQPLRHRPPVTPLDIGAGVIDQVHIVHAGRTCRHTGQTGQAAVDVLDHLGRGIALVLQHVLDEVDAPPRAVELVAKQHIGRAGGGTEAAMDAFADHPLG